MAPKTTVSVKFAEPAWRWKPFQRRWLLKTLAKDVKAHFVYVSVFLLLISSQPDDLSFLPHAEVSRGRMYLTLFASSLSVFTIYFNIFHATPPEKTDIRFKLFDKNLGGHFSFLTINILTFQAYHWIFTLLAELLHFMDFTRPSDQSSHADSAFISVFSRKIFLFTHSSTVFNATLGLVVGLLFLKFVYFEPVWRETVLKNLIKRGYIYSGYKTLFIHMNQTPIALLDLLFIKDRSVLRAYSPSLLMCACLSLLTGLVFHYWTKLNWWTTDGLLPYPFYMKIMGDLKKEAIFITSVSSLVLMLSFGVHFLATIPIDLLET